VGQPEDLSVSRSHSMQPSKETGDRPKTVPCL
jgi:hypothetical protein